MPAKRIDSPKKNKARRRATRVLLVESTAAHRDALQQCGTAQRPVSVIHAPTLAEARTFLSKNTVDLAVVDATLPDGDGFDLATEVNRHSHTTATIVLAHAADFTAAQRALRAGADDLVLDSIAQDELACRVHDALDRKLRDKVYEQRLLRLRRLCKKLNAARVEVSKQVDILCNDLVTAYQELACQMQNVTQTSEFTGIIQDELDLETVLRKTLEHLMQKLGPSNAAIFLPATMDEYSLGGYVNFDCGPTQADMLLEQLAYTLAPRVAVAQEMIHLTTRQDIEKWIGEEVGTLGENHILAVPAMCEDECLAVLVLFRKADAGYTEAHLDRVSSIGPALGESLDRIIRIHHRSVFDRDDAPGNDDAQAA